MKPRTILACFFAAYGVYLVATSLTLMPLMIFGMVAGFRLMDPANAWITFLQFGLQIAPLVLGIVLVRYSSRMGALSARFAGVADEAVWEIHLSARQLLTVLLIVVGVYLLATEAGELLRMLILFVQMAGGNRVIGEEAARNAPDYTRIVTHVVTAIAGFLLAKHGRRISAKLVTDSPVA